MPDPRAIAERAASELDGVLPSDWESQAAIIQRAIEEATAELRQRVADLEAESRRLEALLGLLDDYEWSKRRKRKGWHLDILGRWPWRRYSGATQRECLDKLIEETEKGAPHA